MSGKKSLATPERVTITRKTVFITQLRPHPKNYRIHPPEQIAKLRASYRRLGQFRSLVAIADSEHPGDYTVVAGHGCTEAWGQEGAITVEIDELPPDTPAETVEAIMLADNLHSQGAEDDEAAMAHLLQIQQDAGFDLASLGSDEETLRQMLASIGDEYVDSGEDEIPGINAPDLPYKNQFAVAVMCGAEDEQKTVFEFLTARGYTCKVLVV